MEEMVYPANPVWMVFPAVLALMGCREKMVVTERQAQMERMASMERTVSGGAKSNKCANFQFKMVSEVFFFIRFESDGEN